MSAPKVPGGPVGRRRPPPSALKALAAVRKGSPADFDTISAYILSVGISYKTWERWCQTYRLVWEEHQKVREVLARKKSLAKVPGFAESVKAAEDAGRSVPILPAGELSVKKLKFLKIFENSCDRVAAAAKAGLEWEKVEAELAEDGPLAKAFARLLRRQDIQIKDALRKKVIDEGNAAALNALARNGLIGLGGGPDDAGDDDPVDGGFYRSRMAVLRETYRTAADPKVN